MQFIIIYVSFDNLAMIHSVAKPAKKFGNAVQILNHTLSSIISVEIDWFYSLQTRNYFQSMEIIELALPRILK